MFKLFVYLKNDTHNFDIYRIYINHQQMYSQTNSIYEKALVIEMKQKIWNVYTLYVQSVLRSL